MKKKLLLSHSTINPWIISPVITYSNNLHSLHSDVAFRYAQDLLPFRIKHIGNCRMIRNVSFHVEFPWITKLFIPLAICDRFHTHTFFS